MCTNCVSEHLRAAVLSVKAQLTADNVNSLELELKQCVSCTPFKVNPSVLVNRKRKFRFPGDSDIEALHFTILLRLCGLLISNLQTQKVATIRDLFYQDVTLFRNQTVVVRALDRLTKLLLLPRDALNVLPAPHGLVAGDLTIALEGGEMLEVQRSNGPSLIPVLPVMYAAAPRAPAFLLVVEKEAVFSHLQSELQEGVIITGRGFPDHATRRLVKILTVTYPDMPIYGLVDSDPHGILILHNYENGSEHLVEQQEPLHMTYLGVSLLEYTEGLVPLTSNDIRVSRSTLQKDWIYEPKYAACRAELQRGLFMHQKGEMNLLDTNQSQRLSTYVRKKIMQLVESSKQARVEDRSPRLICHEAKSKQHESLRMVGSLGKRPAKRPVKAASKKQKASMPSDVTGDQLFVSAKADDENVDTEGIALQI